MLKEHYTVWVGAMEVNDHLLTKPKAEKLKRQYEKDGYVDVVIEKTLVPGKICLDSNSDLLTGSEAYLIIEGLRSLIKNMEEEEANSEGKPWFNAQAVKDMVNRGILWKLNKMVIPVHAKNSEELKNGKL